MSDWLVKIALGVVIATFLSLPWMIRESRRERKEMCDRLLAVAHTGGDTIQVFRVDWRCERNLTP